MSSIFFSNSIKRNDFLRNEMNQYGMNMEVMIAVAFFTDEKFIQRLVENGCMVKLIVRLGFPTDYRSLESIIAKKNVNIRYFTSTKFHPKLYIYGNDIAFLGSSNLTDGGLMGNQELNVSIDSENPEFDELKEIFYDYWKEASVLTEEVLRKYREITIGIKRDLDNIDRKIMDIIGKVEYANVTIIDKNKKKNNVNEREQDLLKDYQTFLSSFEQLEEIYKLTKKRIVTEELPIRIEIHRFLNWVRDWKANGELYLKAPLRSGDELTEFLRENIQQYHSQCEANQFLNVINRYRILNQQLGSSERIKLLSKDDLLETLSSVTAFYEHTRHSKAFQWKQDFLKKNGEERIKNTLTYLLYGKDDFRKRIARCICDMDYSLVHFGESCIKELYGWVNRENIPIYNGRVQKSMQWLGFGRL
ncbi:phospholipase D family protein [Paenibacillus lutimineralis]|uniref:NgoFVII family restriction endonuclease n=1 Tax=Paenibacillus lutimineralis TaxID=2707005 RepID=A0A3Q9I7J9_9BACL|nr:phospholipase D family protein [Paenibacillus lutimineralis]AZS14324.1 NgoFVII family restriction endonuclease [Paenibacillus lutimineralis]